MTRIKIEDVVEPDHYTRGERDAIDFVKAVGHLEGFCLGNVIKYLYRYQFKGDPVKDLLKAKAYLAMLIGCVEDSAKHLDTEYCLDTEYWKAKERMVKSFLEDENNKGQTVSECQYGG